MEVHVGSKEERENEQGIAHFLEHAVFLGTQKYPDSEKMRLLLATWGYGIFFWIFSYFFIKYSLNLISLLKYR